jgi:hypothetical protein
VHHSKLGRPTSAVGHFRPSSVGFAYRPLPLSPKSGHSASARFMSTRPNWHLLQTGGFSGRPRVICNRHVIDAS